MKTKLLIALFMIFLSFLAKAQKTFRHDHATCEYKGEKIELDIRGFEQYSPEQDNDYGEIVILKHLDREIRPNLHNEGIGRYTFLKVYNDYCPKALATSTKDDEIAFFIMKDNRPFANQILILYYNIKTQDLDVAPTKLYARTGLFKDGRVYLKVAHDTFEDKYGTIIIGGEKYNFVEKNFEQWVSFDGRNFKFDLEMTREKFEHKQLLPHALLRDFNEHRENKYRIAVNPTRKKSCLSLNHSDWICR